MIATVKKDQKNAVYIEEGCDLLEFEENVNLALKEICDSRDIREIKFQTGVQSLPNGLDRNWYSIMIHHKEKPKDAMNKILKSLKYLESKWKKLNNELKPSNKLIKPKVRLRKVNN
jgi:hypothetical protein